MFCYSLEKTEITLLSAMPVPPPDVLDQTPAVVPPEAALSAAPPDPATPPVLYRPNVAAIILNMDNMMLVAQRSGLRSAWQFPQGGVDAGEGWDEALFREVEEEVGLKPDLIQILDRKSGYRYDFPKGRLKYGIYGGQEQVYYLCRFIGKDKDINLDTEHREFDKWRWIKPEKFDLEWVPRFKREVYRRVLMDFFGLER
jgi:putative (di)nucleoside polyphosphate hydrolase